MRPGDVVADRFVIQRLAGAGGMGAVYRATDRIGGTPIALKVLHPGAADDAERFVREARVLAELIHPAIVRYVAHGSSPSGPAYLAMEWLDGEDLAQRLARGGLALQDSIELCRRAAEGLAAAHARGIVHRDVKPSNLFLVGGEVSRIKLLDFGVARRQARSQAMTRTGAILGTVGYMSPELATGATDLDSRSDVFALGCVLFECLTGQPAFSGPNPIGVLAKVLAADVPRARELVAAVPEAVDDLVVRMLAKDRRARPADAAAVARELMGLADLRGSAPPPAHPSPALTGGERRLVSAMLVEIEPARPADETISGADLDGSLAPARALVRRLGGELTLLPGGMLLATLAPRGSATDQAAQAAGCALRLMALHPSARIALATGRAETDRSRPVGPVIERAAALLDQPAQNGVRIDDVTAGLLDARFDVEGTGPVRRLVGARVDAEGTRRLLGRATPCVGRDKEIGLLVATFEECVAEPVARAVLVTAPAGAGKSRVRRELIKRARASERATVLSARGDPVGAGSALELVRQLLRAAAGCVESDAQDRVRALIGERLALLASAHPEAALRSWTGDFLAELVGPPPSDPGPELRAARGDARALSEWLGRALRAWLAAECSAHPVLLVLEDLHWGDQPSVGFLAEAARSLGERPLMILALARPEVRDVFPRLSFGVDLLELPLPGLTRRSAETLVRDVLGVDVSDATVRTIVERADGNAFYLEELIRRVAEGGGDELPDTVLAMVEARLEALAPDARRVLRAASVFGGTFSSAGLSALAGAACDSLAWLPTLVAEELVEPILQRGADGDARYAFRHALVREAAYGTLTPNDRAMGHRLAARFLEARGDRDALALAEHYSRAGEPARAAPWLASAAQSSLEAANLENATALAERAIAAGASGELRGRLRVIQAQAIAWATRWTEASALAEEARALVAPGSAEWFRAAGVTLFAGMSTGAAPLAVLSDVRSLDGEPEPSGAYGRAMSILVTGLVFFGQRDLALELAERLDAVRAEVDVAFAGWREVTRATVSLLVRGDLGAAVRHAHHATALLDGAGDPVGRVLSTVTVARAQIETGLFEQAQQTLRRAAAMAEPLGASYLNEWVTVLLTIAKNRLGQHEEALALGEGVARSSGLLTAHTASVAVANAHLGAGRLDEAEATARRTLEAAGWMPLVGVGARSLLARVQLARGNAAAALHEAEQGLALAERTGDLPLEVSTLLVVRAEALHAMGDRDRARAEIADACARIERKAAGIEDAAQREAYLERVQPNARTLELARAWR